MATAAPAAPDVPVAWAPHPGSQSLFVSCPHWECLYTGTRGPGKTDALLMDFVKGVGRGRGSDWRGILFRHEYKPLSEIVKKSEKWFHRIFPDARFLRSQGEYRWAWPGGEELLLRAFKRPSDYWDYHGHEYPWIGWEELTAWSSGECYHVMKSCNRSSADVPIRYRATCNPYGPGHNWVKAYFIDPAPAGVPFVAERSDVAQVAQDFGVDVSAGAELRTVVLHGHYTENETLMAAQPNYPAVVASAAANPQQAAAWLQDDWDIVSGGMFDDVWSRDRHVLPIFEPPDGWTLYRSLDWGSTKPFSIGWWARANGEATTLPDGNVFCPPRGSFVRMAEWYGWDGKTPNTGLRMTASKVAEEGARREKELGFDDRVKPGPGDMPTPNNPEDKSVRDIFADAGLKFTEPNKGSGSRMNGWEKMRDMLAESAKPHPEEPGLWVTEACRQFIRTVPTLPRSESEPDDINTDAEDHVADETRYMVTAPEMGPAKARVGRFRLV